MKKEAEDCCVKEEPVTLPQKNGYKIEDLKARVLRLEKAVSILEIVAGKIAMANGLKVEKFQNGIVIISQM
jgi:hypothetical protein